MSLKITHLNADATFLLIFSPPFATQNDRGTCPGSFTVLLDPWLAGPCTILNKHFAQTTHSTPASIQSICDLPSPDLILLSQEKPDHCHAETLTQLPPDSDTLILGTPSAAKKVRSWNHFNPENVQPLKRFDEKKENTLYRIPIPSFSPSGAAGEVTVALLAPKHELTGLHNAIAFTYRPPSSPLSIRTGSFVNLPPTPPATPPPIPQSSRRSMSPGRRPASRGSAKMGRMSNVSSSTLNLTSTATPFSSMREKTLSVVFSPHGVPYKDVEPYATSHLLSASALPLTALFHSFDEISNPWYLGGRINIGSPGGLEIARRLFAKVWIGAHDEDKDNTGFGTKKTKVKKWRAEDVKRLLEQGDDIPKRKSSGTWSGKSVGTLNGSGKLAKRCGTDVVVLPTGEEYYIQGK